MNLIDLNGRQDEPAIRSGLEQIARSIEALEEREHHESCGDRQIDSESLDDQDQVGAVIPVPAFEVILN
jgi:hypothetical protein